MCTHETALHYVIIFSILFLVLSSDTCCVGMARVGTPTQTIAVSSLADIDQWSMGQPLHSLVIIGETHSIEDKMLSIVSNALKT